jgi:hypothetical protein
MFFFVMMMNLKEDALLTFFILSHHGRRKTEVIITLSAVWTFYKYNYIQRWEHHTWGNLWCFLSEIVTWKYFFRLETQQSKKDEHTTCSLFDNINLKQF